MSSCRHDCSSRQTDSNTLHIPPSRGKRLISNGVARQLVSACGECEVGSTCAQLVWQAFPGSYGWESGNRLASGWSPSPPNSPLSPFPGLWHQLPAKQKDKELRPKKKNTKNKKEIVQLGKRKEQWVKLKGVRIKKLIGKELEMSRFRDGSHASRMDARIYWHSIMYNASGLILPLETLSL